ncbi:zinc finger CCHC domain-containing protein 10-like isoform X2 [Paramacrobiotus metropolitanus]|uniref:zinc finger CCHC domain-containing protein 10-like isoform X2 n=1 Tax=Paramacrobiotus metropolitanus TaxID=2943436 RepID=UPI0024458C4C|nr:zinc finger CCHC domain-containing protein 10-like isoform X2 [Paramacrobiotus metropolitanus]
MPPTSAPGTILTKLALTKKSQPAPESIRCQKCLQKGHWTYQCDKPAKYASRPSRTTELKKSVKQLEEEQKIAKLKELAPQKKRQKNSSSESDSSGPDSSSGSSDSDSSSGSSSESSSESDRKKLVKKDRKRSKRNPSSSSGSTLGSADMAQEADSEGD